MSQGIRQSESQGIGHSKEFVFGFSASHLKCISIFPLGPTRANEPEALASQGGENSPVTDRPSSLPGRHVGRGFAIDEDAAEP